MDLEHLTKHQIVLLTLLVSFMTSIVTGIVTVSLMEQAPVSVTRTVNQIVERTVQTVVPSVSQSAAVASTKTVVVKDDDLVAQSIQTLQKSVIRITAKGGNDLVARGVLIDTKGTALTDRRALAESGADAFDAILSDGTRVALSVKESATSSPLALVSVAVGTSSAIAAAPLADLSKVNLGQSVIRIGGTGVDAVGEGVIAMLPSRSGDMIESTVNSSTPGSILTNLFGAVIGITTTASLDKGPADYTLATIPQETKQNANP